MVRGSSHIFNLLTSTKKVRIMAAIRWFFLIVLIHWAIMGLQSGAVTYELDDQALRNLYRSLNSSSQLENWKSEGGDPCQETWTGVQCFESSIIDIKLQGLGLTGTIDIQLSNFRSLKHLDLSSNNIEGSIPDSLPPNVTHLNLACNRLTQSIPYSLENLKHLHHLNVSHNSLSGSLGNVFKGLENLKQMDLSFNNFSGDLPISFTTLANLSGLFLHSNQFTGSVVYLANLSLTDLNIEDNHFSGVIPEKFQNIPNLRFGGNKFNREIDYPPWAFPSETMPGLQNISSLPTTNLSAFTSHPSQTARRHNKKRSNAVAVFGVLGGLTVVAAFVALAIVLNRRRLCQKPLITFADGEESMRTLPIVTVQGVDYTSMTSHGSPNVSAFSSSPTFTPSRLPPLNKTMKMPMRRSFAGSKSPTSAKVYTVAELEEATNNFSEDNLIGEGSLGSVYRAEFPDGKIMVVKNIKTVPLSIIEEQQFFNVIKNVSRLRHPNVVKLVGYCMEHGQHLLVYEYTRNLSLYEALHCPGFPLSWPVRLRIALGIAQALDYIHSSPMAHSDLKAANVLLDEELKPHICDCGLSMLKSLTSNTIKLKASEMAIADSGYIAPEHVQRGTPDTKADVYAYGVLLLELLTGRKPFDSSRSKTEQSLARWASSRLHDSTSIRQMVDPSIIRTMSSKTLSNFADIISICIQPQQEFRPQISEVVDSLMHLLQKPGTIDKIGADPFDVSFRSANTKLLASPTASYYSV